MSAAIPCFSLNGQTIGSGNLLLAEGALIALMNVATQTYLQANANQSAYTVGSSSIGNAHIFKVADPRNGRLALFGPNNYFLSGLYNGKSPFLVADVSPSIVADYTWLDIVPVSNGVFGFKNPSSGGYFMNLSGSTAMFSGGGIVDSTSWRVVPVNAPSICAVGNNMATDFCQSKCQQDMTGCAGAYAAFCPKGDNIQTALCKAYGKTNQAQNAIMDTWFLDYCKANPNELNFCGCVNPSPEAQKAEAILAKAGATIIPVCTRASCSANANAWKTLPMLSTQCAPQNICAQSLDAVISESQISGITFSCNQTTNTSSNTSNNTSSTNSPSTTTPSGNTNAASGSSSLTDSEKWAIGGGIAGSVCLLSICIAWIVYTRRK